ncbi:Hpt domain-containing protein [Pseudodonghicola flavimaris]|uniref:Hpt domain-containing protein n=1 Tax=Pseudodonghicola flavimaris TaxID=3050036 RepID=A0ABT7EZW1_9RHOB|nr:Hpt domain-containing protein [Pseudodonghicola flavimaris]MDK3017877.1 Hpt domain-containing protein [Pseudodonghicola flavimaris]
MILWSRVNELRDEVGSEDFQEVIDLFLEEVEGVIARLREDGDRSQLEQDLHFLKGSALNLGFATFSDLCQDGERMAASGNADDVDLSAVVAGYEQSKAAFFEGLSTHLAA